MITSISRRAQKKHEMNKGKKERDNAKKIKENHETDRQTDKTIDILYAYSSYESSLKISADYFL